MFHWQSSRGNVNSIDYKDIIGSNNNILGEAGKYTESLDHHIRGRTVLITGAGGSIGSEICRRILKYKPKKMILLDQSESPLFNISHSLDILIKKTGEETELVSVVFSIQNKGALKKLFRSHEIEDVYHVAAYKHVSMVENNVAESVANNVFGTLNLIEESVKSGVDRFVFISTDKAVKPINSMGATKRVGELIVRSLQVDNPQTVFLILRFGNVLASAGSVVPLFCKQIASGGPVTITHPDVQRYFISIEDAATLVCLATTFAKGGEIFMLDMGKQFQIEGIARKMIQMAGLEVRDADNPHGDVPIVYIGMREGEKIQEDLLYDGSTIIKTEHPKIMRVNERFPVKEELDMHIKKLKNTYRRLNNKELKSLLLAICA